MLFFFYWETIIIDGVIMTKSATFWKRIISKISIVHQLFTLLKMSTYKFALFCCAYMHNTQLWNCSFLGLKTETYLIDTGLYHVQRYLIHYVDLLGNKKTSICNFSFFHLCRCASLQKEDLLSSKPSTYHWWTPDVNSIIKYCFV